MGKFETEQTSSTEIHDDPFLGRDRAPLLIAAELVIEQFGEKAALMRLAEPMRSFAKGTCSWPRPGAGWYP
jgi:hypothetical protein